MHAKAMQQALANYPAANYPQNNFAAYGTPCEGCNSGTAADIYGGFVTDNVKCQGARLRCEASCILAGSRLDVRISHTTLYLRL